MAKTDKYTIKNLQQQFPSDDVCLDFLFDALHSRECSCGGTYSRVKGRKQYQCSKCRFQIAPTAGTIFHKSATPLTTWFYALFVFSNAKSGISAKELERQIGVTYKCAWRMLKQIRRALGQDKDKLGGDVEFDTAYFGGVKNAGKNNHNLSNAVKAKGVVMGAYERGGKFKATVVPNSTAVAHHAFLTTNIEKGSRLLTDNTKHIVTEGYFREKVTHSKKEYARGDVHVNNVEVFWGHAKRSIRGTYKAISRDYLQSYLDAFVFHYNNRHSDTERFAALLGTVLRGAR